MQRTQRRRRSSGSTYAWLVDSTAMVKHFYFYVFEDDFGPFFLKFCSNSTADAIRPFYAGFRSG